MLSIETVTPEMAQEWLDAGIHERYGADIYAILQDKEYDRTLSSQGERLYRLELGERLRIVLLTDTNEVYDGALQLHALVCHGKPVECAVVRAPSARMIRRPTFADLPTDWGWGNVPNQHRPEYARAKAV